MVEAAVALLDPSFACGIVVKDPILLDGLKLSITKPFAKLYPISLLDETSRN